MMVCLDVGYRGDAATTACLGFASWSDAVPAFEEIVRSRRRAEDYAPGRFFRRELPFLLEALDRLEVLPAVVVVDGYAWLAPGRKGLGAELHEALGGRAAVVGVAKNLFRGAVGATRVLRGRSRRPLYVTAAGLAVAEAAAGVRSMHGAHRIPTLLKLADLRSRAP